MRWLVLGALAGCVPLSADEYAGGKQRDLDSGMSGAETREDATSLDAMLEVSEVDGSEPVRPPPRLDADVMESADAGAALEDASVVLDAQLVDAARDAQADADAMGIDCNSVGVLCDDFELGPTCPDDPKPHWGECEHIANQDGPQREGLFMGGNALRSRISDAALSRSQRVTRMVPLDADTFEVEFWLIIDPSPNEWFYVVKLQQEAGADANGEPTHWPGISIVGSNNQLKLVIEAALNLKQPVQSSETDLGPLPSGWTRVKLKITWKPAFSVSVDFVGKGGVGVSGDLPLNMVPLRRQYLALGLYSEDQGAVQLLFDDVFAHATKAGQLIALP